MKKKKKRKLANSLIKDFRLEPIFFIIPIPNLIRFSE